MQGGAAAGESETQEVVVRCATGSKSTGHATWQELSCACLHPLLKQGVRGTGVSLEKAQGDGPHIYLLSYQKH